MHEVTVRLADFSDAIDADAVLQMTRAYALDPMGSGKDLPGEVQSKLIEKMKRHPAFMSFIAWDGEKPVGIANCLESFSTFKARSIINVHDLAVVSEARGLGVSRKLMGAVEEHARSLDCAAITLEVYGKNYHARDVYHAMGFSKAREAQEEDLTLFCTKEL